MLVWNFLLQKLETRIPAMLLLVLESEGSSPGRQGFKMGVAADGELHGSIGGGIMEHKLVEKARSMLKAGVSDISLMRQYHDKEHADNQSGMICSGSQLIAFVPLWEMHVPMLKRITEHPETHCFVLSEKDFQVDTVIPGNTPGFEMLGEHWHYSEWINERPVVHIFGAGHVGLALSEVLRFLGFYIKIYDDRPGLNTLERNRFAHEKHIISYENIAETLKTTPRDFIALMTMGYRQDKLLFTQLVHRDWFYLGMLGSDRKIRALKDELVAEGFDSTCWEKVFAPIGMPVFSKTPAEIAVSIAAEMIREKNKHLPTGREVRSEK